MSDPMLPFNENGGEMTIKAIKFDIGNSCFWLVDFSKSFPLELFGQMY
jgi:hypothetical protein